MNEANPQGSPQAQADHGEDSQAAPVRAHETQVLHRKASVKPCPSCRSRPCADGRARCLDCLETELRRINAVSLIAAAREASTRGLVNVTSAIVPTGPDRVLIDWQDERELRGWANIPDEKCRPIPKDLRRANGRKRDIHKPKPVDLHLPTEGA